MAGETYLAAGVDLEAARKIKEIIRKHAATTLSPQVLAGVGAFGGMYQFSGFKEPVLVSSTDNVGTKLKIAAMLGRYDTVGQDVVNQSVNDIFSCGAKPLFFLDYIATSKIVPERIEAIVKGVAFACREARCSLIGGETAEQPGLFHGDDFDLSGFIVGAVEKSSILDGSTIRKGDTLLGVPSSGLHTNGYSLTRKVFGLNDSAAPLGKYKDELGCTLGEALLAVHRPYYPLLESALPFVKAMAHITGGSFYKNVPRVLPEGLAARFDKRSWEVLPIFRLIQKRGRVAEEEMYRVFNMGIGMVLVCDPKQVDRLKSMVEGSRLVGEVIAQQSKERILIS